MPATVSRGRGRRTINEINMVPFIDVMLVLLIIFMVSAPLITTGVVDLPSVGKSKQQPKKVIEVVVAKDETFRLRVDNKDVSTMTLKNLADRVSAAQGGDAEGFQACSAERESDVPRAERRARDPVEERRREARRE